MSTTEPTIADLIAAVREADAAVGRARSDAARTARERRQREAILALERRVAEAAAWLEAHWNDGVGYQDQDDIWIAVLEKYMAGQRALYDVIGGDDGTGSHWMVPRLSS